MSKVSLPLVCDAFDTCADVISRRYPVPHPLTLTLALKVKFQVKAHGRLRYPWRLNLVRDYFGGRADIISVWYPEPRPLTSSFTFNMALKIKIKLFRAQRTRLDTRTTFRENMNLSLNASLNSH